MPNLRKIACSLSTIALASMLAFPSIALGATCVNVDGQDYTTATSESTWSWDGADNMTLTNYVGSSIVAEGNLILTLVGNNLIDGTDSTVSDAGIAVNGNLSIVGEGNLQVKGTEEGVEVKNGDLAITGSGSVVAVGGEDGIEVEDGNLSITGGSVQAEGKERGIAATGDISVKDADVLVNSEGIGIIAATKEESAEKANPTITFDNSKISVDAKDAGIVSIYTSKTSEDQAIQGRGSIVLENSTISVGGQIRDVLIAVGEDDESAWFAGQTITEGSGTITDASDYTASVVVVEPEGPNDDGNPGGEAPSEPEPDPNINPGEVKPMPNASETNSSQPSSILADTGDKTLAFTASIVAATAAAAVAIVSATGAALRTARKEDNA